jgi:cytoskeletal protein CcmA (bactofilin family)
MLFKKPKSRVKSEGAPQRLAHLGPSIITADVMFEGQLVSSGELQIDGTVRGDVRAAAVAIDTHGVVYGEIVAEDVLVRGRVIGPIRGLNVQILNGGHVEGDVLHQTIAIENGAYFEGSMRRSEDPLAEVELRPAVEAAAPPPRLALQPDIQELEEHAVIGPAEAWPGRNKRAAE